MKRTLHPLAEEELFEAMDWYESRVDGLGAQFLSLPPDEIFVLAIAHQKRRPEYWKDRL